MYNKPESGHYPLVTYINKGLNLFSLFFENVQDFKLNYYVQHRNSNFHQLSFLEFYADSEFYIKFLRI